MHVPRPKRLYMTKASNRIFYFNGKGKKIFSTAKRPKTMKRIVPHAPVKLNIIGDGSSEPQGLYNSQIETILKKVIKSTPGSPASAARDIPVIPSDAVGDMVNLVKPNQDEFAFIINTNPSNSDGSGQDGFPSGHWMAVYFNNKDSFKSAEFFDPLDRGGIKPDLMKAMKQIALKMNPETHFLFKDNKVKQQADNTVTCGYHAIKFLQDRFRGVPWSEATGFKKNGKEDNSVEGEKAIEKTVKKYNTYL